MSSLTINLPDELLEAIAERAAGLVAEQLGQPNESSPWLSIDEASDYTGVPKHTLYKLTAAKAVPHCKPGSRLLFNRVDLDAWINGSREGPVGASQFEALGLGRIGG